MRFGRVDEFLFFEIQRYDEIGIMLKNKGVGLMFETLKKA
ncbi:hypothetical protein AND4_11199 [Vibrio sp. AND4]|nr:hypothetical protein AND4_11199 [Vibrio sp. AND4]